MSHSWFYRTQMLVPTSGKRGGRIVRRVTATCWPPAEEEDDDDGDGDLFDERPETPVITFVTSR